MLQYQICRPNRSIHQRHIFQQSILSDPFCGGTNFNVFTILTNVLHKTRYSFYSFTNRISQLLLTKYFASSGKSKLMPLFIITPLAIETPRALSVLKLLFV